MQQNTDRPVQKRLKVSIFIKNIPTQKRMAKICPNQKALTFRLEGTRDSDVSKYHFYTFSSPVFENHLSPASFFPVIFLVTQKSALKSKIESTNSVKYCQVRIFKVKQSTMGTSLKANESEIVLGSQSSYSRLLLLEVVGNFCSVFCLYNHPRVLLVAFVECLHEY